MVEIPCAGDSRYLRRMLELYRANNEAIRRGTNIIKWIAGDQGQRSRAHMHCLQDASREDRRTLAFASASSTFFDDGTRCTLG
jgi:hypothetical protein